MQKDVIYIDTEDDITAIIGKVLASEHKIVALVPPKRIGAIQSAVNLKLVHRAATQADKRLVVISSNAALTALASSVGIPVAKNLQSKPELAEIPALEVDDGEDVIDGSEMTAQPTHESLDEAAAATAAGLELTSDPTVTATPRKTALGATALAAQNKVKIPNFDRFRKKLFFIIAGAVLLVAFLVWAVVYAPSATITVTARTSDSSLNTQVKLGDGLSTDLQAGTIKTVTKTLKKDVSVPFTATGTKNVGTPATGKVSLSNAGFSATTVAAGTTLKASSGNMYTLDNAVSVPSGSCVTIYNCHPGTASGTVTATAPGTVDNGDTGALSGAPDGVTTSFVGASSGGTDKNVTVVQQSDIDSVSDNIVNSSDNNTAKNSLTSEFGKGYAIIGSSFKTDTSAVKPNPAVGAEADSGSGTLTGPVTFSLTAVPTSELNTFLSAYFTQQIDGQSNQKVYDNGAGGVSFTNVNAVSDGFTANITTNGKIGPNIDEGALKSYAKGKRLGEIQSYVQNTNGVSGVEVKFSPFWVTSAPNDVNRIHVEFKVNG